MKRFPIEIILIAVALASPFIPFENPGTSAEVMVMLSVFGLAVMFSRH